MKLASYGSKIRKTIRGFVIRVFWLLTSPAVKFWARHSHVVLTCTRGDGGGAQWHGRFSVMAFADSHGLGYYHSDFDQLMPENTGEKRDLWSRLFVGEYSDISGIDYSVKHDKLAGLLMQLFLSWIYQRPAIIDVGHMHIFTDYSPKSIIRSLSKHKVRYNNPALIPDFIGPSADLAMHVRRGLSWEENFTPNRITNNEAVLERLERVVAKTGAIGGVLYSGLPSEAISGALPEGFFLDTEASEFVVIHHLITAKYVILAKSCMSYIAGCFAQGVVFYDPFFHPPLADWEVLE